MSSVHILIPLDGSQSTEEVLYYTHSIASSRSETKLTLLHVLPEGSPETGTNPSEDPCLKTLDELLAGEGWKANSMVRAGKPVKVITDVAREISASLILMSTHGRSGLERICEGSVTENVLRISPCPVFILHSRRPEPADQRSNNLFRRILVPLDGTDESAKILPCVERFALSHDSEVVLFHDSPCEKVPQDCEGAEITHTRTLLEEQIVKLANAGLKERIDWTSYRHPIREILNTVDKMNIDLVAMATHTKASHGHPLEESVTADVIRHASCPLLVWAASNCEPGIMH